jgi:hypothetical protein|nr:MAG TPA: hypothetical protein [Caudoviricetes sp.]
MIDLKAFDNFLESLYIKKKVDRNKIINLYKRLLKQKKSIIDFETGLEKLSWEEITIQNITNYVLIWNYRRREDERIWKNKKN